jgi:hypothetical protein
MSAKSKFTFDDVVQLTSFPSDPKRLGTQAWVVGVMERGEGPYMAQFPPGYIYTIEFEDGSSTDVHEDQLKAW